jgi:epoxyqueuosine reductase QueG
VSVAGAVAELARAGLSLTGALRIAAYDSLVSPPWRAAELLPGARGALVVGNAGRALWERFQESAERALADDPLDRYVRRVLAAAASHWDPPAAVAFYADRREGVYLPIVALARRAGFGTPGRIGVLIHPQYGPWIAIRAVLLTPESLVEEPVAPFDPCSGCPAPCAAACVGLAVGARTLDARRCYDTRLADPACAGACAARSACVVGREHAYAPQQLAHHMKIRRPLSPPT